MLATLLLAAALAAPSSQPALKSASGWKAYGAGVPKAEVVPLASALESAAKGTAPAQVSGTVSAVCEAKGCWMVVNDGASEVRVTFKDYGFFVPWGSEGKAVRMAGVLKKKTVSKETYAHWLSEQKNPPMKPEDVKGPQTIWSFEATGVEIQGGTELSAKQKANIGGEEEHDHSHEGHDHHDH